jgi:hypothetical protein
LCFARAQNLWPVAVICALLIVNRLIPMPELFMLEGA